MEGINQVNVNPKQGLDFAQALRSFLRQDPDVIMVGEIRDLETAEIAIKAAQTGHLVLSTLHTNSAAETLTRLLSVAGYVDGQPLAGSKPVSESTATPGWCCWICPDWPAASSTRGVDVEYPRSWIQHIRIT